MSSRLILSIDDDPLIHRLLRCYLRDGMQLLHEMCPFDGLRTARERTPDLILLDVEMPGMNGFELCRMLKEDVVTARIPVVFLTGQRGHSDIAQGLKAGAADYITKPVGEADLRSRVHVALSA